MKRNVVYSLVVFLLVESYLLFGMLTQLLMGVVKWGDTPPLLGLMVFMGAAAGGIFYFAFTKITENYFGSKEKNSSPYAPSRKALVASIILIAISSTYGGMVSYSVGGEQKAVAEKQKAGEEKLALAVAKAAEKERQRIASLTPGQRADEEKQKRENAARKEAAAAKVLTDKEKRDTQLQVAGAGAVMLKRAMKDPEAFELKSLLVMPNGTACYDYRAKNSFGAILSSSAVLTDTGKMLLQERDGNAFVNAWNKNCTVSGGDEIAPLVKSIGVLD